MRQVSSLFEALEYFYLAKSSPWRMRMLMRMRPWSGYWNSLEGDADPERGSLGWMLGGLRRS
jgi:hypothetical protein